MRVLGLDGCPGGWAGVLLDDGAGTGRAPTVVLRRFEGWGGGLVDALAADVDLVAVDIPIGLPALGEVRACDTGARRHLGRRAASVFPAPARELLGFDSHAEASATSRRLTGRGISIQAWNIYARIAAVDAVVSAATQRRLVEVHPELAFRRLAGGRDLGSNRTGAGRDARAAELSHCWPVPARLVGAKPDDVLDAAVCAWSALRWLRGEATLIPAEPQRDARGLLMAIAA